MTKGLFIVGTDTGIGKTVVTAGLLHLLRNEGYKACYFKPALSGAVSYGKSLVPGDTRFVKTFSGLTEKDENITPYIFKTPVSPHLAAKIEGKPINIETILKRFQALKEKYDYIIAEGAGGLAVPLTEEGYMLYDLIKLMGMNIVVVAKAGLGTINHTLLTVKFAESLGLKVKGIIINGYKGEDLCEKDNVRMISSLTRVPVLTVLPFLHQVSVEKLNFGNLKKEFEERIKATYLVELMS